MQVPLHPLIAHFPLTLAFLLPVLIVVFAILIKNQKMNSNLWLVIVGMQIALTVSGYIALENGEIEEDIVSKIVPKEFIHDHENMAEIFVGTTVVALVVSIAAYFARRDFQFKIRMGVAFLSLVSVFFGYKTGQLGGELVYKHGAATIYYDSNHTDADLLPVEDVINESLKLDETDYEDETEVPEEEDVIRVEEE